MITHIEGKLVEKNPAYAIIDCHGVGYLIYITLYTFEKIPNQENIKLFTHLMIREDSQTLYGFYESVERTVSKSYPVVEWTATLPLLLFRPDCIESKSKSYPDVEWTATGGPMYPFRIQSCRRAIQSRVDCDSF